MQRISDLDMNNNNSPYEFEEIKINLYLSDIDINCILSSFINFNKFKTLFTDNLMKFNDKIYKMNLNLIKFYVDDLVKYFIENKNIYKDYFDYVLANLPQTPSQDSIRSI